jgi:hypothetical protein
MQASKYWGVDAPSNGVIVLTSAANGATAATAATATTAATFVATAGECGAATFTLQVATGPQTRVVCADNNTGVWQLRAVPKQDAPFADCSFMARPGMTDGRPTDKLSFHAVSQPYLVVSASNQTGGDVALTLAPAKGGIGIEFATASTFTAVLLTMA